MPTLNQDNSGMADISLCQRCDNTPFATFFASPQTDVPLVTMGKLWSQSGCRFCDLLKHTLVTFYGAEYMQNKINDYPEMMLWVSQSPIDPRCDWNKLFVEESSSVFYLELYVLGPKGVWLERLAKKTTDDFDRSFYLPKMHLLRVSSRSTTGYGKATLSNVIDWDHLWDWVKICDGIHARPNTLELSSIPMLVVDIYKMCIVPMPTGSVRYIALSYMWGKDQPVKLKRDTYSILTTPGALGQGRGLGLSRTIQDTIRAVELLGCRYVWVDALCIIQDDLAHLKANVGAMDKIYPGAWLTIVAAAGDNADGGLPGVHPDLPRAETQMRVDLPQANKTPITVANMLDSAEAALNFSTWDIRGWTYQERVLSHRLLSFTDSQVYFYCDCGCLCREDMYPVPGLNNEGAGGLFNTGYELSFEYDDLFTI